VQSLANLGTKDGLVTFAGINSSQADQDAGKNEHLRAFEIKYPPRKKQKVQDDKSEAVKGEIKLLGKSQLFRKPMPKSEVYQRVLRLSPAVRRGQNSKRIGAVATGMAKDSEMVVFDATSSAPGNSDIIAKIYPEEGAEVNDIDIAEPEEAEFSVVYCTDYDILEQTYKYDFNTKKAEKTPKGPRRVYQMPFPDALTDPRSRPKFRAVRFLNAQNMVVLANTHKGKGSELRILHLYPTGPATAMLQKALPSRIKSAVSMDVCALDVDKTGNQQVIVAVAGQDISIEIFTTNYQRASDTFSPFKHYITERDVHQHQMTKICLSPFHPRTLSGEKDAEASIVKKTAGGKKYVWLASVSYGNTVVVDTFPLSMLDPEDKNSRYVLSHPSDERIAKIAYISIATMMVLVTAFLLQSFLTGFAGINTGPFSLLPQSFREFLDRPAAAARGYGHRVELSASSVIESDVPTVLPGTGRLRSLLASHAGAPDRQGKALVVRSSDESGALSINVHPDQEEYLKADTEAKRWEELSEEQQRTWKDRLVKAGEWVEGQGEKVLIGVLFSEYAGIVGGAVRDALAG